jgi:hypothetical protein
MEIQRTPVVLDKALVMEALKKYPAPTVSCLGLTTKTNWNWSWSRK